MNDTIRTLKNLGLNGKETQTYLLLLQVGASPASAIGKRMELPKSTARYLCQELVKKGLVTLTRKENTFLYAPESPDKILLQLDRQKEKIDRQKESAQRVIAELKTMMHPEASAPKLQFYEGLEGVKDAYERVIREVKEGDEILSYNRVIDPRSEPIIVSGEVIDTTAFFAKIAREQVRKKVTWRTIAIDQDTARSLQTRDPQEMRETRLVQTALKIAPVEIILYGDSMCSVTYENGVLFAYIMQNRTMVEMHRLVFELAWAKTEKTR